MENLLEWDEFNFNESVVSASSIKSYLADVHPPLTIKDKNAVVAYILDMEPGKSTLPELVKKAQIELGLIEESKLDESEELDTKAVLAYFKNLQKIEKEEGYKSKKIKLNAEMDTISKFSRNGSDTTLIKKLIKDYEDKNESTVSEGKGEFANTYKLGQAWFERFKKHNPKVEIENDKENKLFVVYNKDKHILTFNYNNGEVMTDLSMADIKKVYESIVSEGWTFQVTKGDLPKDKISDLVMDLVKLGVDVNDDEDIFVNSTPTTLDQSIKVKSLFNKYKVDFKKI